MNAKTNDRGNRYIFIGLGAVVVFYIVLAFSPVRLTRMARSWLVLGFETSLVFAFLVKWFWPQRRMIKFWFFFFGVLPVHLFCLYLILNLVGRIPGIWQIVIFPFEAAGLALLFSFLLGVPLDATNYPK